MSEHTGGDNLRDAVQWINQRRALMQQHPGILEAFEKLQDEWCAASMLRARLDAELQAAAVADAQLWQKLTEAKAALPAEICDFVYQVTAAAGREVAA